MTRFSRKVVAIALAATMLFSTMVTTAFANNNQTTYEESANILKGYGVLVGDNGNLMLDQQLKRQDAVVISLRLMGKADSEFENYANVSDFSDIKDEYYMPVIGMAQDLGLIEGMGDGTFGFDQKITAQQLQTILLRALGYEITDDIYANVPQMAQELGINNLVTAEANEQINRALVAQMMLNALNTNVKDGDQKLGQVLGLFEDQVTPAEMTVAAASVKSIKVTFNKAVDTTKAAFEVKKEAVKLNVSNVAWNEAKTEATLTMAGSLTEGDYSVTVSGIEMKEATKTITVKDEEVGKIEFTTDKAIQTANEQDLYTFVKVSNQYGQDITEDANITFTATKATGAVTADQDGKVSIPGGAGLYEVGDKITVTALDPDSGAFATTVLTVVEKASADVVTIVKINNDDEDATLDENATGFELLLNVKDQYGNVLKAAEAKTGLLVSSSNTTIVDADEANLVNKTIDDVDYVALPLTVGENGKASIRIISKATGKSVVYEVNVLETAKVDTVTLSNPELAVAGEDIDFAVTAVDQNGKAVTDAADLNTGVEVTISGITGLDSTDGSFVKEDGKLIYRVDANALTLTEAKTMYLTAITDTNKVVQKSVKVNKNAVPTTVGKLVNVETGILEGNNSVITASAVEKDNNVVVYDQYDRAMDLDAAFFANYKLVLTIDNNDNMNLGGAKTASIIATNGTVTLNGILKGTEQVTVAVWALNGGAPDTLVANSEYDFNVNVVELKDIKSFEVKDIPTIYAPALANPDYDMTVEVYGVLSNGAKVVIPANMFSVVTSINGLTVTNDEISALQGSLTFETNKKEIAGTATVTIGGATGPVTIEKAITVSKATPVAAAFKLDDSLFTGETASIATTGTVSDILAAIEVRDQYDVVNSTLLPVSIIFSNKYDADKGNDLSLTNGDGTIDATNDAAITAVESGDTFSMTMVYSNGKTLTVNVVVE